jgi:hypothetical protein
VEILRDGATAAIPAGRDVVQLYESDVAAFGFPAPPRQKQILIRADKGSVIATVWGADEKTRELLPIERVGKLSDAVSAAFEAVTRRKTAVTPSSQEREPAAGVPSPVLQAQDQDPIAAEPASSSKAGATQPGASRGGRQGDPPRAEATVPRVENCEKPAMEVPRPRPTKPAGFVVQVVWEGRSAEEVGAARREHPDVGFVHASVLTRPAGEAALLARAHPSSIKLGLNSDWVVPAVVMVRDDWARVLPRLPRHLRLKSFDDIEGYVFGDERTASDLKRGIEFMLDAGLVEALPDKDDVRWGSFLLLFNSDERACKDMAARLVRTADLRRPAMIEELPGFGGFDAKCAEMFPGGYESFFRDHLEQIVQLAQSSGTCSRNAACWLMHTLVARDTEALFRDSVMTLAKLISGVVGRVQRQEIGSAIREFGDAEVCDPASGRGDNFCWKLRQFEGLSSVKNAPYARDEARAAVEALAADDAIAELDRALDAVVRRGLSEESLARAMNAAGRLEIAVAFAAGKLGVTEAYAGMLEAGQTAEGIGKAFADGAQARDAAAWAGFRSAPDRGARMEALKAFRTAVQNCRPAPTPLPLASFKGATVSEIWDRIICNAGGQGEKLFRDLVKHSGDGDEHQQHRWVEDVEAQALTKEVLASAGVGMMTFEAGKEFAPTEGEGSGIGIFRANTEHTARDGGAGGPVMVYSWDKNEVRLSPPRPGFVLHAVTFFGFGEIGAKEGDGLSADGRLFILGANYYKALQFFAMSLEFARKCKAHFYYKAGGPVLKMAKELALSSATRIEGVACGAQVPEADQY